MLCGEAVVAIWNDITPEGRADFYAWHLHEHMPERAGIPGFHRGRRYIAADPATAPEFFTLYEADTMGVLQGSDYLARLNAPTPWTKRATAGFRNTFRALARVLHTQGPGAGGAALTCRFDAAHDATPSLIALLRSAAAMPRISGVHLCAADDAASEQQTAESAGRADLQTPPSWFAMVEATDTDALTFVLPDDALIAAGIRGVPDRGLYRLEYIRAKTAFAAE